MVGALIIPGISHPLSPSLVLSPVFYKRKFPTDAWRRFYRNSKLYPYKTGKFCEPPVFISLPK